MISAHVVDVCSGRLILVHVIGDCTWCLLLLTVSVYILDTCSICAYMMYMPLMHGLEICSLCLFLVSVLGV